MGVTRVMGLETEYGITHDARLSPMLASGIVVRTHASAHNLTAAHGCWDYSDESPLRDARGFDLDRGRAHPSQLTDEDDPSLANVVLPNGARLYVDHAHPEYSSPEVLTPMDALTYDRAGHALMADVVEQLETSATPINLYRNNTDSKGASYGTHENYLISRETPFEAVISGLTPFFVSRQIFCGAGRVGLGQCGERPGFQLSQRADFMEAEVGLETTFRRPIINTRDEPHADADRWRRLHVIVGDANLAEVSTLLKLGASSLVLALIESGHTFAELTLADPVAAIRAISHDPTLTERVDLADGRSLTALEIQQEYLQAVTQAFGQGSDPDTAQVLNLWQGVLTGLASDPRTVAHQVDWAAKYRVMQASMERWGCSWDDPRVAALDIHWSDIRPRKSIFHTLESQGSVQRLTDEAAVQAAMIRPPRDTRAWFRGQAISKWSEQVISASWDSVVFANRGRARRISMSDPRGFTEAETTAALTAGSLDELLRLLPHPR